MHHLAFPARLRPMVLFLMFLGLSASGLTGCGPARREAPSASDLTPLTTMKAEVTYRERMLLPPGCTLFLTLENISQLDRENNGVATAFIPVKAAPPFSAVVRFDPRQINGQLNYALSARIELKGQVLFAGSARVAPLKQPKDEAVPITVKLLRR